MRTYFKDEIRKIGMTASRSTSEAFTVATATYEVKDQSGTVVESGTATIEGAVVFFLADFTKAAYVSERYYYAYFTVTITGLSKIIKDKVGFMVL